MVGSVRATGPTPANTSSATPPGGPGTGLSAPPVGHRLTLRLPTGWIPADQLRGRLPGEPRAVPRSHTGEPISRAPARRAAPGTVVSPGYDLTATPDCSSDATGALTHADHARVAALEWRFGEPLKPPAVHGQRDSQYDVAHDRHASSRHIQMIHSWRRHGPRIASC